MAQAGAPAAPAAPAYSEFDYSQHSHDYSQAGGADPAAPQSEAGGSAGGAHQQQQQQQQPDNTYSDYQREYLQQHQGYAHAQYAAAQQHGGYDMHAAAYGHHPQHPQQHEYAASQYGGDGGGPGSGGPGAADGYSVYSGHAGWGYDQQQQQQQHQLQQQQHQPYQQQQHAQLQHQHSMYGSGYGAAQGAGGGQQQGGGQGAYLNAGNGWSDLSRMSSVSGASGIAGPSNNGMGGQLMPPQGPVLTRTSTHLSLANSVNSRGGGGPPAASSSVSLGGASGIGINIGGGRRKSKDTDVSQMLPFNKEFVDEYRTRMKDDPDPEAQFAFAKYLIEAAKRIHDPRDGPKQARKYRDNLLSESLKLIKRLATTGMGLGKPPYAEAQFFLANCFGNGSLGLQVDHEKAYNLYVQASKQNHPAATYRTAVCNEVGAGTKRDHHRAVLFFRKASALGDTAGMYKIGMILLNGLLGQPRNPRDSIVWLKRAAGQADEENPHALHELGLLYERAPSVPGMPPGGAGSAALSAASRAAEARAELAQAAGIVQDEGYARELYTQAAQLGYAPSQFKLGSAYEFGSLTCAVDPKRSIAWYTKAAQKGDGESELALSGWYLTGSDGVLKQSDSEAYLWARRAAIKGIPKAEYAVGYYSEVGIGVKPDLEEAKRWYMRAAAQGNKRAIARLTELKRQGNRPGKRTARPTRKDAENECVVIYLSLDSNPTASPQGHAFRRQREGTNTTDLSSNRHSSSRAFSRDPALNPSPCLTMEASYSSSNPFGNSSAASADDLQHLSPPPSNLIDDVFLLPDHLYLALSGSEQHPHSFPQHTFAQHTAQSAHFPDHQQQHQHQQHQQQHQQQQHQQQLWNHPASSAAAAAHLQLQPSGCLHDDPNSYSNGITPTSTQPITFGFDSVSAQQNHQYHQPAQPQTIGPPSSQPAGSSALQDSSSSSFYSNFSPSVANSSPYAYAHSNSQHTTSSSMMGARMANGPSAGAGPIDFGAGGSTPATSIFSLASSVPQSYSNHGHQLSQPLPQHNQHHHLMGSHAFHQHGGGAGGGMDTFERRLSVDHHQQAQPISGVPASVPSSFHFGLPHAASLPGNHIPDLINDSMMSPTMRQHKQDQHRRHRSSTSSSPVAARRMKDRSLSRSRVSGVHQPYDGMGEPDSSPAEGGAGAGTGVGKAPSTRSRAGRRASIGPAAARAAAAGGARGRSGSTVASQAGGTHHRRASQTEDVLSQQSPSSSPALSFFQSFTGGGSHSQSQPANLAGVGESSGNCSSSSAQDSPMSSSQSAGASILGSTNHSAIFLDPAVGVGAYSYGQQQQQHFRSSASQSQSQSPASSAGGGSGGGGSGDGGCPSMLYLRHPHYHPSSAANPVFLPSVVEEGGGANSNGNGNGAGRPAAADVGMQGIVKREDVERCDGGDGNDDGECEAFDYDAAGDDGDEDFVDEEETLEGDEEGEENDDETLGQLRAQQQKKNKKKTSPAVSSTGRGKKSVRQTPATTSASAMNEDDDAAAGAGASRTRKAKARASSSSTAAVGKKTTVPGGKRVTIASSSKAKGGAGQVVDGDGDVISAGGGADEGGAVDDDECAGSKAATTTRGKVVGTAAAKKGRAGTKEKDPEAEARRLAERRRRRRESHNAVERRRRDTINEKITELATLLPEAMLLEAIASSTSGGNSGAFDIAAAVKTLANSASASAVDVEADADVDVKADGKGDAGVDWERAALVASSYSLPPLLHELTGRDDEDDEEDGDDEEKDDHRRGEEDRGRAFKPNTMMMSPQTALAGLPFLSISGGGGGGSRGGNGYGHKQTTGSTVDGGGGTNTNVLSGFGSSSSSHFVGSGGNNYSYGAFPSGIGGPPTQASSTSSIPRHILSWVTASATQAQRTNTTSLPNEPTTASVMMGSLNPTLVYAAALAPVHRDSAALAAAQAKPNKGIILRKSVDYIRHLQQFLDMQMGINRALEAEVQALRGVMGGGDECGGGGRERATTVTTKNLHDFTMATASGHTESGPSQYQPFRSQPLTKLGSLDQLKSGLGGADGGAVSSSSSSARVDSSGDAPATSTSATTTNGGATGIVLNPGPGLGSNGTTHSGRRASPPPPLPTPSAENRVQAAASLEPWMGLAYDARTGLPRRPSPEPESMAAAAAGAGKQSHQTDRRPFSPAASGPMPLQPGQAHGHVQGQPGSLSPKFSPGSSLRSSFSDAGNRLGISAAAAFMMSPSGGGGGARVLGSAPHGGQNVGRNGGYEQRHGYGHPSHGNGNGNGHSQQGHRTQHPGGGAGGGVEVERGRPRTRSVHPVMSSSHASNSNNNNNSSEGSWPELKASAALSRATSEERLPSARMTPAGFGSQSRMASLGRVGSPGSPRSPMLGSSAALHRQNGGMHQGFVGLGLDEFFASMGGAGAGILVADSHSGVTAGEGGNGLVAMEE
ncbi:unnamed protein product [Tilletia controversa]|nr:unnamed protein product [Tilletia controversa]CAD6975590.1 unnamed protein product [Tilletia controversa]CAD7068495.1 unnamed protein product [Tilletia caries]